MIGKITVLKQGVNLINIKGFISVYFIKKAIKKKFKFKILKNYHFINYLLK